MIIYIILAVLVLIALVLFLGSYSKFKSIFARESIKESSNFSEEYLTQYKNAMKWLSLQNKKELWIEGFDKAKLYGCLYQLTPGTKKVMIAAHSYSSNGNKDMSRFARFYRNLGYDFLIIDLRAHGQSEGRYTTFGALEAKDCLSWVDKVIEIYGEDVKIALHGVSLGAASLINMSSKKELPEQVKALISDCSFAFTKDVIDSITNKASSNAFINMWIRLSMHTDVYSVNPLDSVKKSKTPILFIHGEGDTIIPSENADRLYDNCESKRWIFKIPKAQHAQSYLIQPLEYEKIVTDFLKEYIEND